VENTWELFQKGGPVMYVLLVCSIVVAVIAIERFRFYRQAGRGASDFVAKLPELLKRIKELEKKVARYEGQEK